MSTMELVIKSLGEGAIRKIEKLLRNNEFLKTANYLDCLKKHNLYGNSISGIKMPCDHLLDNKELAISEGTHCCRWCGRHFTDKEMKILLEARK